MINVLLKLFGLLQLILFLNYIIEEENKKEEKNGEEDATDK
tara:strand:- start:1678 stop:1800 length:123 start_codon:yes stop_codon:yes gene_type:complete